MIFRNPFQEFILFIIVSFILHCPPYSVLLCIYNVHFKVIFLYSMMLDPQYPWLQLFRSYKRSIILKSIRKHLSLKIAPYCNQSIDFQSNQLTRFYIIRVFTKSYFRRGRYNANFLTLTCNDGYSQLGIKISYFQ